MEEYIKQVIIALGLSLLFTAAISPLVIGLLYKMHFTALHKIVKNKINQEFVKLHQHKNGTPTMGGIMIWLTIPLLSFLLFPNNKTIHVLGWLFVIWGLVGFIDGALDMATKMNLSFRQFQNRFEWRLFKLGITYLIGVLSANMILNIHNVSISWLNNQFILGGAIVLSMYAAEITDGLDGLFAGLSMRILGFIAILFAIQQYFAFLPFIAIILGALMVYLYFNIPPARIFMGGPGAMPIGVSLFILMLITNNFVPYLIMTLLMWMDLSSSMIQLISMRFFDTKIFKIAPIHHHFEANGWPEYKITMRAWLMQTILCILAIAVALF